MQSVVCGCAKYITKESIDEYVSCLLLIVWYVCMFCLCFTQSTVDPDTNQADKELADHNRLYFTVFKSVLSFLFLHCEINQTTQSGEDLLIYQQKCNLYV